MGVAATLPELSEWTSPFCLKQVRVIAVLFGFSGSSPSLAFNLTHFFPRWHDIKIEANCVLISFIIEK